jgi:VIT1/CCC1 family predicted Fe2+/Mn2+ transporter
LFSAERCTRRADWRPGRIHLRLPEYPAHRRYRFDHRDQRLTVHGSSEYLSTIQETGDRDRALKSALYTGLAYVLTVSVLILPFLLLANPFASLGVSLFAAVLIIFVFNYYISVAKDTPFKRRFLEMALISLGVSGFSF